MNAGARIEELLPELRRKGLPEVELYLKEGRSRRYEIGPQGRIALHGHERGWALRAGSRRASLFASGSGVLAAAGPWPDADGEALYLPSAAEVAPWNRPPEFDAPLLGEGEAIALLEGVDRQLGRELPGARLLSGVLEEGSSEASIANSRGLRGTVLRRSASLYLEAGLEAGDSKRGGERAACLLAERAARGFSPSALARRLADRLSVRRRGGRPERDRGDLLLAPAVMAGILAGLEPLLVGPGAEPVARALRDRSGRVGSRQLTVVDDGRHPKGVFDAPIDGEGVETRRNVLIEQGTYRQPLLDWRQARPGQRWSGCSLRASWRDLPHAGPTHLFVEPDPEVSPRSLVAAISRGYYLLETAGRGRYDFEADRFEQPVRGFVLRQGESHGSFSSALLTGAISALLRGVQAVARDLTFHPSAGLLGAPTTLVTGVELRAHD